MKPAVIVPAFAFSDDPWRTQAYFLVRRHLFSLGWSAYFVPAATPAQARNVGAQRSDGDVLVFNDADTLVPLEQIRVAASVAADSPGLVFAFSEYRRLGRVASEGILRVTDLVFDIVPDSVIDAPPSHGCVAISRAAFNKAGGYDERLEVWEDCALTARCAALWPLRRVDGSAVHLWHPRVGEPGEPEYEARYAKSRLVWEAEYPWPVEA